ncbi:unnamed protein product [Paramecium octaurelia]|uniref:Uncharacterized protein n=1 Tax=Paramecium octaurelia TaxID=43137 RepID=A0A8S1VEH9_PAROT|nr:unnamed protein product [Paramecium octaurelia]
MSQRVHKQARGNMKSLVFQNKNQNYNHFHINNVLVQLSSVNPIKLMNITVEFQNLPYQSSLVINKQEKLNQIACQNLRGKQDEQFTYNMCNTTRFSLIFFLIQTKNIILNRKGNVDSRINSLGWVYIQTILFKLLLQLSICLKSRLFWKNRIQENIYFLYINLRLDYFSDTLFNEYKKYFNYKVEYLNAVAFIINENSHIESSGVSVVREVVE